MWRASVWAAVLLAGVWCGACTDPDMSKNVTQIILERGYPCQQHAVTTEDGYILQLQRINTHPTQSKGVAFLQHGLLDSSITWVIGSPNASLCLAFILADAGYDVWLGNSRGNVYAQQNTNISPDTEEFWEFSWDQFVTYDIPAKISYIIAQTGASSLFYVGHSEGSNIGLATLSSNPAVAQHVSLFVALAPAAFVGHALQPAAHKVAEDLTPQRIETIFGTKQFPPPLDDQLWHDTIPAFCQESGIACEDVVCWLVGCESSTNINTTRLPVILNHYPADTSVQNMIHYWQMLTNDTFAMFDYGPSGNIVHYNSTTPPNYPLPSLMVPTAIFYGSNDELADPTDVQHLLTLLPPNKLVHVQEIAGYGHGDFVWGLDAAAKVYSVILELFAAQSTFPSA
eukprot:m.367927 g.367927  ORF g.367927 m.367927 type:complete len:398 (-) comp56089_c0_seq5:78-1271(-)